MKNQLISFLISEANSRCRGLSILFIGLGRTNKAIFDILKTEATVARLEIHNDAEHGDCTPIRTNADIIIPSPSFRRDRLIKRPDAKIITDTDLFSAAMLCERERAAMGDGERKDIFLVTGSDGKSTSSDMTARMLRCGGRHVFLGGNIGTPLIDAALPLSDAFVIELSSFNLMYSAPPSLRAVITNITENHLDWHRDMEEYASAKMRIYDACSEPIVVCSEKNGRYSELIAEKCKGGIYTALSDELSSAELRQRLSPEHTVTLDRGQILYDGEGLIPLECLRVRERHNIRNLMTAIALTAGQTPREAQIQAATEYTPLPHRGNAYFAKNGGCYVDSSIDTTPERTRATLEGLGKRVHLLVGGRGKELSLDAAIPAIRKYAISVASYGEISRDITELMKCKELSEIPYFARDAFDDALCALDSQMKGGETMLLSPMATAYGEFTSFAERGGRFLSKIRELHGELSQKI